MENQQATETPVIARIHIDMEPVESSQIRSIGHDEETSTLAIEFHGGGGFHYRYANVSRELFEKMREAKSVGSFFYKNIRYKADEFPYQRLHADEIEAQEPDSQQ